MVRHLVLMILILAATLTAQSTETPWRKVLRAQERATLTTPIAPTTINTYDIVSVTLQRIPTWALTIVWQDNAGKQYTDAHRGVGDADVLVKALNTANLNPASGGKSLERRAIEHLQMEGKIGAGTIVGSPQ